jgi:hypothetical protein
MHPRTTELLNHLDQQRAVLRAAYDAVPASLRERAPAPGQWSAAQCVEHVAIVGGRIAGALTKFVDEAKAKGLGPETATEAILPKTGYERVLDRRTKLNAPDPIQPKGVSGDAAWVALEQATAAMRASIAAADGLALGSVSWPHPALGPLNGYQWIALNGAHEARHAAQIREITEALSTTR